MVAGRGGSGRRGSGSGDNRVMFCVVCCGAGENYCVSVEIWCEWIFFFLGGISSVSSLVQNFTSLAYKLRTSFIQVLCIYKVITL